MTATTDCLFCRKHSGLEDPPYGGYLVDDGRWLLNHAHPDVGEAGTLILSSRRHFLDFGEMTAHEAASFQALLRSVYPAIKSATGAARVYLVAMMANVPHFHVWLIPQAPAAKAKAFDLLVTKRSSTPEAVERTAAAIAEQLRRA